ncbi:MAG: DNA-packaging protein [Candidatus Cloacimonetes bacterium]|nr:DNA-packaging protein [Candidatus Cloacimonadota bacterium]
MNKKFELSIGRPLKYKTLNELEIVCQKYFDETPFEELTVTGLALWVGSKQTIQDYEKREGYKDIVFRAKLVIENSYEVSLRKYGRSGDIFALKNFGWKDKIETEHSGSIGNETRAEQRAQELIDEANRSDRIIGNT